MMRKAEVPNGAKSKKSNLFLILFNTCRYFFVAINKKNMSVRYQKENQKV